MEPKFVIVFVPYSELCESSPQDVLLFIWQPFNIILFVFTVCVHTSLSFMLHNQSV